MTKIFEIMGQVVSKQGFAIQNIRVAVLDKDLISDDLLGLGFTDENGEFQLSFTRNEFNQDPFENEDLPDLCVICSVLHEKQFKAIYQHAFPELTFENGSEDLGSLVIETWVDGPEFIEGLDPAPGLDKRVARLNITEPLVRHCLEEVAPHVEELTGWPGLLDDLNIDVTDDMSPYFRKLTEEIFGESSWMSRQIDKLLAWTSNVMALYDPTTHTVALDRTQVARYTNLDGLKVILGHELVHVGQFKAHPELVDQYRSQLDWLKEMLETEDELDKDKLQEALLNSNFHAQMSELEGYAHYIQRDFLERRYNLATFFNHSSLLEGWFRGLVYLLVPSLQSGSNIKGLQYTDGSEVYRNLGADADTPVPFQMDVIEPKG